MIESSIDNRWKMTEDIEMAISDRTQAIIASNEALARSFGESFNRVNGTLEWGFNRVVSEVETLTGEVRTLHSEFTYCLGLLHSQMLIANKSLEGIFNQLDRIHETLKHPRLTEARELSQRGLERLQRGLLPEALKALLESAEKNETDFLVHYNIGKLYLYGKNKMDTVIDLPKAEEHLRLAARYAYSEISQLPDAAKFCGEAFFHASIACYAQSNDQLLAGDTDDETSTSSLREMLNLAQRSIGVYSEIPEAFYHHAKYAALLGDGDTCAQSLKLAILMDRNYCLKVEADPDFDGVRDSVHSLFASLHNEEKVKANNAYQSYRQKLDPILSNLPSDMRGEADGICKQIESYLAPDTYFDYMDALPEVQRAENQLPEFQEAFDTKKEAMFAVESVTKMLNAWNFQCPEAKQAEPKIRKLFQRAEPLCRKDTYFDYLDALPLLEQIQQIFNPIPEKEDLYQQAKEEATKAFEPVKKLLEGRVYQTLEAQEAESEIRNLLQQAKTLYHRDTHSDYLDMLPLLQRSQEIFDQILPFGLKWIATLSGESPSFSPDSKYLKIESSDDTWKIYQTDGFNELATLRGWSPSWYPSFSPDDRYLAIRSGAYKIYETDGFKEIATLSGKSHSFSPDSRYLVIKGSDVTWEIYLLASRVKGVISQQEFEEQERRRIEAEKEAEKEAERRRKEEEEEQRKREAEEGERRRKEQELREHRRKSKVCLECGAKLGILAKLSGAQYCKKHKG